MEGDRRFERRLSREQRSSGKENKKTQKKVRHRSLDSITHHTSLVHLQSAFPNRPSFCSQLAFFGIILYTPACPASKTFSPTVRTYLMSSVLRCIQLAQGLTAVVKESTHSQMSHPCLFSFYSINVLDPFADLGDSGDTGEQQNYIRTFELVINPYRRAF